jgi:hypothetical protein
MGLGKIMVLRFNVQRFRVVRFKGSGLKDKGGKCNMFIRQSDYRPLPSVVCSLSSVLCPLSSVF